MSIKSQIDKVPIELEVTKVGPAALEDIDAFKETLEAGDIIVVKKGAVTTPNPYLVEEEPVEAPDVKPVEALDIGDVDVDLSKSWWKSKTIIANVLTAAGCVLATFITDNPDMATYLPISALATINLVLRGISKDPIKLPFKETDKDESKKKTV